METFVTNPVQNIAGKTHVALLMEHVMDVHLGGLDSIAKIVRATVFIHDS